MRPHHRYYYAKEQQNEHISQLQNDKHEYFRSKIMNEYIRMLRVSTRVIESKHAVSECNLWMKYIIKRGYLTQTREIRVQNKISHPSWYLRVDPCADVTSMRYLLAK